MEIGSSTTGYATLLLAPRVRGPQERPTDAPVEEIQGRERKAQFIDSLTKLDLRAKPAGETPKEFDPLDVNQDGEVDSEELAEAGLAAPFGNTSDFLKLLSLAAE